MDTDENEAVGDNRTITILTIDDLARLVRLRPIKQIGLRKLRDLFKRCSLPDESAEWIRTISESTVEKPPYREIVGTIESLQKKFKEEAVSYSSLRVELSHLAPPISFNRDNELAELCNGMAQMAPGAIFGSPEKVELDQSADNVIAAIEAALQDYPIDEHNDVD